MLIFAGKILVSSVLIAFSSWLACRKPVLAGFIMALPLSSLIALAFVQAEWKNEEQSVAFAKSILFAVPLSLTFFLPFLFARYLKWPFWGMYALGLTLLVISYGVHRSIFSTSV